MWDDYSYYIKMLGCRWWYHESESLGMLDKFPLNIILITRSDLVMPHSMVDLGQIWFGWMAAPSHYLHLFGSSSIKACRIHLRVIAEIIQDTDHRIGFEKKTLNMTVMFKRDKKLMIHISVCVSPHIQLITNQWLVRPLMHKHKWIARPMELTQRGLNNMADIFQEGVFTCILVKVRSTNNQCCSGE